MKSNELQELENKLILVVYSENNATVQTLKGKVANVGDTFLVLQTFNNIYYLPVDQIRKIKVMGSGENGERVAGQSS